MAKDGAGTIDVFGDGRVVRTDIAVELPPSIDDGLTSAIAELHGALPALDVAFAVPLPALEVWPLFLTHRFQDGSEIYPEGLTGARPVGAGTQYVIGVTAPALMTFATATLIGLLAHEFLHAVHMTLKAERRRRARQPISSPSSGEYRKSFEANRQLDRGNEMRVRPDVWLSPQLIDLLKQYEDGSHIVTAGSRERMWEFWVNQGLPTALHRGGFTSPEDIALSAEILMRAESLGEL